MRIRRALLSFVGLLACGMANAATPAGAGHCDSPVVLDGSRAALRDAFNQAQGKVRLVFLVDPICSGCLRGLSDVNRDALSHVGDDSRVATLVVHLPVLGATQADVANSCQISRSDRLIHFWDGSADTGRVFGRALQMKSPQGEDVLAWDVWTIYGPDAKWVGELPPKPLLGMHQLRALMSQKVYPFLDSAAFALALDKELAALGESGKSAQ